MCSSHPLNNVEICHQIDHLESIEQGIFGHSVNLLSVNTLLNDHHSKLNQSGLQLSRQNEHWRKLFRDIHDLLNQQETYLERIGCKHQEVIQLFASENIVISSLSLFLTYLDGKDPFQGLKEGLRLIIVHIISEQVDEVESLFQVWNILLSQVLMVDECSHQIVNHQLFIPENVVLIHSIEVEREL